MSSLIIIAFTIFGVIGLISVVVFIYRVIANLFYRKEYKVKTTGIDKTGIWRS